MTEPRPSVSPETPPAEDDDGGGWWTSRAVPVLIVLVAAALIAGLVLLARQEQDAGTDLLAGASADPSSLPTTVPVRRLDGALVIDVTFGDGSRTVPMVLDTGGPTIVSGRLADVFSDGSAGTVANTSIDGEVLTSPVVRLPQLAIGDARFSDVGAVVGALDEGNPFSCLTEAGFIGSNLLQTGAWQLDPRSSTLTIAASAQDLSIADDAWRLDFVRASDVSPSPLVELLAGTGTVRVLLDTGSDAWLALSPADFAAAGGAVSTDAPTEERLIPWITGFDVSRATWSSVTVDSANVGLPDPLPVAIVDTLPDGQGIAGTDLLEHFVVTFDWSEDAVYLQPLDDVASPAVRPLASLAWNDGLIVGSRLVGQPGSEALPPGTRVDAIDGRDVSSAPLDTFCRHRLDAPERYELTVAGDPPTTVSVGPAEGFLDPLTGR